MAPATPLLTQVAQAMSAEIVSVASEDAAADAALLERIAAGDRAALTALYARYQRPLMAYLVRLTGDYGLAEEILQDVLVAAWRGAGGFAGRSAVRTWLFGIAHRQAHNALRRQGPPSAPYLAEHIDRTPDPQPGPEDHLLARADRADLSAALSLLSPLHREALVLALVQGLPLAELALVLGVPVGTVKSRLHNARAALRATLARRAKEEP